MAYQTNFILINLVSGKQIINSRTYIVCKISSCGFAEHTCTFTHSPVIYPQHNNAVFGKMIGNNGKYFMS